MHVEGLFLLGVSSVPPPEYPVYNECSLQMERIKEKNILTGSAFFISSVISVLVHLLHVHVVEEKYKVEKRERIKNSFNSVPST